ncbi:MAG TPA: hypothetical protein PLO67_08545 [Saprospiraceae bacterium]|nr:hypothetical protein [Saprospiraceae bacterium]
MKEPETPREWLLLALSDFGITIVADNGHTLDLEKEYSVEIEQNGVFRLTWRGKVVAPFQDLAELCHFIQMS